MRWKSNATIGLRKEVFSQENPISQEKNPNQLLLNEIFGALIHVLVAKHGIPVLFHCNAFFACIGMDSCFFNILLRWIILLWVSISPIWSYANMLRLYSLLLDHFASTRYVFSWLWAFRSHTYCTKISNVRILKELGFCM
jgi:hypothetical protein